MNTFAERLHHYMTRERINQSELADRAKVNQSLLSRYLSGKTGPTMERLLVLSKALRVNPNELLGVNIDPARDDVRRDSLTADEQKLVGLWYSLPKDHWLRKAIQEFTKNT